MQFGLPGLHPRIEGQEEGSRYDARCGLVRLGFHHVLASLVLLAGGFPISRYRERKRQQGKALTDYDFYPCVATPVRFAEFSINDFRLGAHYFLSNTDPRAARQLVFTGIRLSRWFYGGRGMD